MRREDRILRVVFLVPVTVLLGVLVVYPLIQLFYFSFQDVDTLSFERSFVGLRNYRLLIGSRFMQSFKQGTIYAVGSVSIQMLLGIGLALLLNKAFRGRDVARTLILLPYGIPVVVVVGIWHWLLNDMVGIVNWILKWMHLTRAPLPWLGDPTLAMLTLIGVSVYKWYPFVVIVLLARLQIIPEEYYDAAAVDGTSRLQSFLFITLPLLKQTIFIVVLIRFVWMFNKLDMVMLLTGGGPIGSTRNLPLLAYQRAFGYYRFGEAACIGVGLFIILFCGAWIYMRTTKPERHVT